MKPVIIDVRESEEFVTGHVEGAINIPPDQLINGAAQLRDVPKDAEIIVYCRTGSRSNVAMNLLKQMGYANTRNGINKDQVEARFGAN